MADSGVVIRTDEPYVHVDVCIRTIYIVHKRVVYI